MLSRITGILRAGASYGAMVLNQSDPLGHVARARDRLKTQITNTEVSIDGAATALKDGFATAAHQAAAAAETLGTAATAAIDKGEAVVGAIKIGAASAYGKIGKPEAFQPDEAPSFVVGTSVTWTSSNTQKVGDITCVIPAGMKPSDFGVKLKDEGSPRDHESYIVVGVTVNAGIASRSGKYWPRVSLLKKV